jgi:hypothetical protein
LIEALKEEERIDFGQEEQAGDQGACEEDSDAKGVEKVSKIVSWEVVIEVVYGSAAWVESVVLLP